MIKIQLPTLNFELVEKTGLLDINIFNQLTNELKKLGTGNIPKSRWFHKRRKEIVDALSNGYKLSRLLKTVRDIRVLIHLWSTDTIFFSTYPISKNNLKSIARIKTPLSSSQLYSLIRLYFYHFNNISDLKYFCKFIRDNLRKICSKKRLSKDMLLYCKNKDILFDPSLKDFWEMYSLEEITLKDFFQNFNIPWDHRSQFLISSKNSLYLKPVEVLKPGKEDPVFELISKPENKDMPYDKNYSIAQKVSMIMMDKAVDKNMPDNWRQFIIKLLGDPRMPKSSDLYKKSWAGLPVSYEKEMRKWLSQMDLIVFLDILQEIGKQSGNDMIRRMFPARKKFLESLYKTGMVVSTRLFLSNDAIEFIEQRYDQEERPSFAKISHKNKSVIYMQIGKVHLIEGTHNYSARLLDRLPKKHSINDLQKKRYILPELATGLDQAYVSEFKDSPHLYVVPHDIHNAWQRKLIEIFKMFNIYVDI